MVTVWCLFPQALAAEAEEGRVVPTMETFLAAASALCARREPLAALAQLRLIRQVRGGGVGDRASSCPVATAPHPPGERRWSGGQGL
jgi:hypothetical protein